MWMWFYWEFCLHDRKKFQQITSKFSRNHQFSMKDCSKWVLRYEFAGRISIFWLIFADVPAYTKSLYKSEATMMKTNGTHWEKRHIFTISISLFWQFTGFETSNIYDGRGFMWPTSREISITVRWLYLKHREEKHINIDSISRFKKLRTLRLINC